MQFGVGFVFEGVYQHRYILHIERFLMLACIADYETIYLLFDLLQKIVMSHSFPNKRVVVSYAGNLLQKTWRAKVQKYTELTMN